MTGAFATATRAREGAKAARRDVAKRAATALRPLRSPSGHELDAVWQGRMPVQPKLELIRPDDPLEHEADRVAQRVLACEAGPTRSGEPTCCASCTDASLSVARQSEEEEGSIADDEAADFAPEQVGDGEEVDDSEPDEFGMPKLEAGPAPGPLPRIAVPRGPGQPLPAHVRAFFEPRFGRELGAVRVHTDTEAAASARRLNARAYTVGTHMFFAARRFDPGSHEGRSLLAHELVHVLQQEGAEPAVHRQDEPAQRRSRVRTRGRSRPRGRARSGGCPQGKQDAVVHTDCSTSAAADRANFISHLEVSIAGRTVTPTWQGTVSAAGAGPWECSPNPTATPRTPTGQMDQVGTKCSVNHTNMKRDGMAWFTGIARHGMRIGFHDSQPVGPGFVSHGCIRVRCNVAETINRNTSSSVTTVRIS